VEKSARTANALFFFFSAATTADRCKNKKKGTLYTNTLVPCSPKKEQGERITPAHVTHTIKKSAVGKTVRATALLGHLKRNGALALLLTLSPRAKRQQAKPLFSLCARFDCSAREDTSAFQG
jgi:hypothetical protein